MLISLLRRLLRRLVDPPPAAPEIPLRPCRTCQRLVATRYLNSLNDCPYCQDGAPCRRCKRDTYPLRNGLCAWCDDKQER